jgi:hypothetical protein
MLGKTPLTLALAQLVERSTVVENKYRTAAGSIPASQNQKF